MSKGLKHTKHELFCVEYLKDLNAAQAAIRSGYSSSCAKQTGFRILNLPEVRERIEELKLQRIHEAGIDADYVLNRLLAIDRLNVEELLDDNGDLKPVKDWSDDWKTSIQALDIQVTNTGGVRTVTKKVRIPGKLKNLEMLGKHIDVSAFKEKQSETEARGDLTVVVQVSDEQAGTNIITLHDKLNKE